MSALLRAVPRRAAVLTGLLGLLLLALLAGAVADVLALVVLGGLALPVVEHLLHHTLRPGLPRHRDLLDGELVVRLLLEQALVLVFLLRSDELGRTGEVVVVLSVVAAQLLRVAWTGLRAVDASLRQRRADLRNLPGAVPPLPRRSPLVADRGQQLLTLAPALLPLALLWALVTGSYALVAPAAAVCALVALAVVGGAVPGVFALVRQPRGARLLRRVHDAVRAHEPLVVLYSSGGPSDLHWVTSWLGALEALDRPALVMLRQPAVLDLLPPSTVPLVCIPHPSDIAPFTLPSARVGLYVANTVENLRLVRNPALRSAFIGHGDSDKVNSASTFLRVYDETWVAGERGRRRILDAQVGVRPEAVRVVGRPQVRRVRRAAAGPGPSGTARTVLYAPTWEGTFRGAYESSLVHSGREIVSALLAQPGVRVVYRPHPKTGYRDPAFARAHRQLLALLHDAGPSHAVSEPGSRDLYDDLNGADVLVADVSAVVSDFLASGKPYLVVDGEGLPDEEFRARNPSAAAAYLVGPGGTGLAEGLADAFGGDSLGPARRALREHLLGPATDDPLTPFRDAVDALAASADRTPAGVAAGAPPE